MIRKLTIFAAVSAVACCHLAAQAPPPSLLEIDIQNRAFYNNSTEYSKLASDPNMVVIPQVVAPTFANITVIGDIVAVNGKPAHGTFVSRYQVLQLSPNPKPGQAAGDITAFSINDMTYEIQQADGTPVGTIMASGFDESVVPPGAPATSTGFNFTVTGGTGAYLGVRGQVARVSAGFGRATTMAEDPSNRRNYPGSSIKVLIHLLPMEVPDAVRANGDPVAYHSNFTPVTRAQPARAGETVILAATGMGPTRPSILPGTPFPADALAQVNSPVEISVNGASVNVVNLVGWPGLVGVYRVDFSVPDKIDGDTASIQIGVAGIRGPQFSLPVGR